MKEEIVHIEIKASEITYALRIYIVANYYSKRGREDFEKNGGKTLGCLTYRKEEIEGGVLVKL